MAATVSFFHSPSLSAVSPPSSSLSPNTIRSFFPTPSTTLRQPFLPLPSRTSVRWSSTPSSSGRKCKGGIFPIGGEIAGRAISPPQRSSISATASGKYIREDYLVKKVSAKEVQELVKGERSVPLIVDFYATWCGPCILMAQDLEMLAVEYEGNALFVKVDTDDEYEFARDMQVRGLPTLYFFSPDPSKDAIRTEGLVPPEMIKNIIDNEM